MNKDRKPVLIIKNISGDTTVSTDGSETISFKPEKKRRSLEDLAKTYGDKITWVSIEED